MFHAVMITLALDPASAIACLPGCITALSETTVNIHVTITVGGLGPRCGVRRNGNWGIEGGCQQRMLKLFEIKLVIFESNKNIPARHPNSVVGNNMEYELNLTLNLDWIFK